MMGGDVLNYPRRVVRVAEVRVSRLERAHLHIDLVFQDEVSVGEQLVDRLPSPPSEDRDALRGLRVRSEV